VGHVASLWVAPVKGLGLTSPAEIDLQRTGVDDNRRFALVDEEGRRLGALRDPRLVAIGTEWDAASRTLALRFPDGSSVEDVVETDGAIETDLFSRTLRGSLVVGPWAAALSSYLGRRVQLLESEGGGTRAVDRARGPVSILSEASLEELARRAGVGSVDGRRFRMLVHVGGVEPHEEDTWIGRELRLGGAVVRPLEQVARCAITTTGPESGRRDFDTLRAIKDYRGVRDADAIDFGIYGVVVEPGPVRVGDAVEPV
jgi:uncharacterized protein YcbX